MKFYKGTYPLPCAYEYYYVEGVNESYWYFSSVCKKWYCSTTIKEVWASRKDKGTRMEEVSPLEIIVVIGSFPKKYKAEEYEPSK